MAVTRIELRTEPFEDGRQFGAAGSYELLSGQAYIALDPTLALNRVITDLDLAPRERDGRVHFAADVAVLRTRDPARANRRLLFELPNRGNRLAPAVFELGAAPRVPGQINAGDGWLLGQGYTVAWCGWQHDVPPLPGLMRIDAPVAMQGGHPIRGTVCCRFEPSDPARVLQLSHLGHTPYPAADVAQAGAVLQVREHPEGPPQVIPRERWRFARLEVGLEVPDSGFVHYPDGFCPGAFYELVYTAEGAPVTGAGLAAIRDIASFLRFASAEDGNPCAGAVDAAVAYGASQCGGVLRTFVHLGLCEDEQGRLVFDGILPHIAGAFRSEVNRRFGQPSYWGPYSMSHLFPFTDELEAEPETGRVDGLLRRARERGRLPKVIYANTSSEYWYLYGALTHTTLDGTRDLPLPENVRSYHFAGAQHGRGGLPLTRVNPLRGAETVAFPYNTVDYTPLLRAALVNLDRWVTEGREPPPSRIPRIDDGTLVERESLRERVARIPGLSLPVHMPGLGRLDFGREMERGIPTRLPPTMGPSYPMLVPAIDDDGNEIDGVRHPDVAAPLATHAGWNQRHPSIGGAGQGLTLAGLTLPFPRTAAERRATGDPRPSIAERYTDRGAYLERVRAAAEALAASRYLLADDIDAIVRGSADRYDAFMRPEWSTGQPAE